MSARQGLLDVIRIDMANILEEVQQFVADKLNADPQLSACPFLVENKKDIDFEIKNALGKQGIVGLVMTPKATFAGAFQDVGLAWQLDELEISIVESVTVNRGKKTGYVTGQDASMRMFDVLCPLSGEGEGQFSPVSYEEGEDGNLLVNNCILKCLVHKLPAPEMRTKVAYVDGSSLMVEAEGVLSRSSIPSISNAVEVEIGNAVSSIGVDVFDNCTNLTSVTIPGSVKTIGNSAFFGCRALASVVISEGMETIDLGAFTDCRVLNNVTIPSSVTSILDDAFFNCEALYSITFSGKDKATVQGMSKYPWSLQSSCVIHCTDGDITI